MSEFDFSDVARRVPFKMVSHMAMTTEHALMHRNEALNINCETITKYRNGSPGKAKRWFYINEKGSKEFETLADCLNANPLVGQLAEATYPAK